MNKLQQSKAYDQGVTCDSCQESIDGSDCEDCDKSFRSFDIIYCEPHSQLDCNHYCKECGEKRLKE